MLFTLRMADSDVYITWKLLITEKQGEGKDEFSINHIKYNSTFFQCWNKIESVICQRAMLG